MSKTYSANIYDPNHTSDDYDLYFNGELIESSGELKKDVIRRRITASTGNIISFDLQKTYSSDAIYIIKLIDVAGLPTSATTFYADSASNMGYYKSGSAINEMSYTFSLDSTTLSVTCANPTVNFMMNNTLYEITVFYGG